MLCLKYGRCSMDLPLIKKNIYILIPVSILQDKKNKL